MFGLINGQEINGTGSSATEARIELSSPLGSLSVLLQHDFTEAVEGLPSRYVMDLTAGETTTRVPISSWQATLQTGAKCYVQCVVPACTPWVDSINTAETFTIQRQVTLRDGLVLEYIMAQAPADQAQFDRGPQRHTCTLSGYSEAFAETADPPESYNRTLQDVRSISKGEGGTRARAGIDWLLRPGHRAIAAEQPFVASYINYYVQSGDAYMDVGDRT